MRALSEDPRELPETVPAVFESAEPVRILGELPFQLVPEPVRAGGQGRSRGGPGVSRLCSVEARTGIFEGRHLQSQCWRGRRLTHGGPETEENAPSSPRRWSGETLAVQALGERDRGLVRSLAPGAGAGRRRSGHVVGAGIRQDRAAARVPALVSGWSLPRGEGDRPSFSLGRGPCGLGPGTHLPHPHSSRLDSPASAPRTAFGPWPDITGDYCCPPYINSCQLLWI